MTYSLNLAFDRFVGNRPYPNLAPTADLSQGYGELGKAYPFVVPLRLLYYAEDHGFNLNIVSTDQPLPSPCFYPVALGFFSFDVDYFALMSDTVMSLIKSQQLTVLFYYHEGDNPWHEKTRLDELCRQHQLSVECYRFVSGNTASSQVPGFVYFADHELFYWRANRSHQAIVWNDQIRSRTFTALNRTHKWWRASVMADMHRAGMLDQAYWSYNTISIEDHRSDNPIQTDWFPGLDSAVDQFLSNAPYTCDDLDSDQHNQHHNTVVIHFRDSYFQVVLETMFDADQSSGTFLTEKTFKPIKHAQPFVLIAPPGSLATLRELGYMTFDDRIINTYDTIVDNTQRWIHVRSAISSLLIQDLHRWSDLCYHQCIHNQQLFSGSKLDRLNNLAHKLNSSLQ